MSERLSDERLAEIARGFADSCQCLECRSKREMAGELLEARKKLAELRKQLEKEELAHLQTIDERDQLHDVADRLSWAIADPDELGEHSSLNDPWHNAIVFAGELHAQLAETRKDTERLDWLIGGSQEIRREIDARIAATIAIAAAKEPKSAAVQSLVSQQDPNSGAQGGEERSRAK